MGQLGYSVAIRWEFISAIPACTTSTLIMAEIEIFISNEETQTSFLSIPRSDIERLAVSPLQWIRYVMFAICGARGELSTTPDGPAVDYENTEIGDENKYYYRPFGKLPFCV
jgi:hypothetical protein